MKKPKLSLVSKDSNHQKRQSPSWLKFKALSWLVVQSPFTLALAAYILGSMIYQMAKASGGHGGIVSVAGSIILIGMTIAWESIQ